MMQFAFSTLGTPNWSLEHAVEVARSMGYSGIELRLLDADVITPELLAANRSRIQRAFADSDVALIALGTSARFTATDPTERRANEATVIRFIEEAVALGCPMLRVFGGMLPNGTSAEEGIARVAESLNRIAPSAEKAGVTVALETHDDFSSSERVAAVLAQVPSRAIGALWDTHHPYRMGEALPVVWTRLADRLVHVHVKDAVRQEDGKWRLVLLGEGEVPVREVVRALDLRGYQGWVSVEWEKKWHPEIPDPEVALPQHIERLREYLAE